MTTVRRVYLNGDSVKEEVGAYLQDWINYNRLYRPGCALLVDGVVVELGYYTQADRAKLETFFAADRCISDGRTSKS